MFVRLVHPKTFLVKSPRHDRHLRTADPADRAGDWGGLSAAVLAVPDGGRVGHWTRSGPPWGEETAGVWSNGPAPRFCPKNPSPTYQAGGRLVGCSPPGSYSRDLNHEINGQEAYIGTALGHSTRTPLSSWFHQNFPTERLGFRHAGINGSLIRPGIQKTIVSMVFTKQPLLVYLGF